jgi:hypothetical protein
MRHHEPVDVVLPALGALSVVLPDHLRAVPQDVSHLLKSCPLRQEARRQRMAVAVSMGIFDSRFLEDSGECPLRDSLLRRGSIAGLPLPGSLLPFLDALCRLPAAHEAPWLK